MGDFDTAETFLSGERKVSIGRRKSFFRAAGGFPPPGRRAAMRTDLRNKVRKKCGETETELIIYL